MVRQGQRQLNEVRAPQHQAKHAHKRLVVRDAGAELTGNARRGLQHLKPADLARIDSKNGMLNFKRLGDADGRGAQSLKRGLGVGADGRSLRSKAARRTAAPPSAQNGSRNYDQCQCTPRRTASSPAWTRADEGAPAARRCRRLSLVHVLLIGATDRALNPNLQAGYTEGKGKTVNKETVGRLSDDGAARSRSPEAPCMGVRRSRRAHVGVAAPRSPALACLPVHRTHWANDWANGAHTATYGVGRVISPVPKSFPSAGNPFDGAAWVLLEPGDPGAVTTVIREAGAARSKQCGSSSFISPRQEAPERLSA
jgi:hypothetical protein